MKSLDCKKAEHLNDSLSVADNRYDNRTKKNWTAYYYILLHLILSFKNVDLYFLQKRYYLCKNCCVGETGSRLERGGGNKKLTLQMMSLQLICHN